MQNPEKSGSLIDQVGEIEFRLHAIAEAKRRISKEMSDLDSEAAQLKKSLEALEAQRAELRRGLIISDHALVRWLERRHGLDLDIYRREMSTAALRQAAAAGLEGLKTAEGTFKIKDGVVTTFMTSRQGPS